MCTPLFAATVFIEATQDNTLYESPTGRLSNGSGQFILDGLDGKKTSNVIKLIGVDGTSCE